MKIGIEPLPASSVGEVLRRAVREQWWEGGAPGTRVMNAAQDGG